MSIDIVDSILSRNRAFSAGVNISAVGTGTVGFTMSGSTLDRTRGVGASGLALREFTGGTLTATITDSLFTRNGLGVLVSGGDVTLTGSTVTRNRSGGVFTGEGAALTLTNSIVSRNRASGASAGIQQFGPGSTTIVNSTIRVNRARCEAAGCAGGIGVAEGSLALTNAIVWGNVIRGDASDLNVAPAATASAGTSDLGGVSGTVTDLGGNISADPLCVGRDDDHLTAASPAVDTGACLGAPATDIDGDTRPTRRLRHGRRRAGALSVRL